MPSIEKRFDLRLARLAFGRLEKKIVVALRVERRIEIDEVHRFIRDLLAQDLEIVAVVKLVHCAVSLPVAAGAFKRGLIRQRAACTSGTMSPRCLLIPKLQRR